MDNLNELKNLLNQVEIIVKKYDDLALQSGEKFNVFDIIGLRNDEVRMHSRFIGELLNPNGTHNQGGVFLKLFLDIVNKEIYNTSFVFDINNFKIVDKNIIERFIGQTNVSKTNGGRIDLILESDNQVLIIENKIFAKNQENQLIRYTNYARKLNKEFYVFYLTINENWIIPFKEMKNYNYNSKNLKHIDNPGSYEEFIKDNKYKNCSFYTQLTYNNHILNWLDKCKKNKTNNELLNNGIEFYINLLNILTNQTMEDKRTNDILDFIFNKNFSKEFYILSELKEEFLDRLCYQYFSKIFPQFNNNKFDNKMYADNCYEIKDYIIKNEIVKLFLYLDKNRKNAYIGLKKYDDSKFNKKISKEFKNFKIEGLENDEYKNDENDIFLAYYQNYFNEYSWEQITEKLESNCDEIIHYNKEVIKRFDDFISTLNN